MAISKQPASADGEVAAAHNAAVDEKPALDDASEDKFQPGVQRSRAITTVWSRKTMWLMFGLLYLVSFSDALLSSVQSSLNPYITSVFGKHGLLTSVSVIATILGGCTRLTMAKVVDVFGRTEGYLFNLLIMVIGLILKATCKNIETYVAAHALYWVGHVGLGYILEVMLADMTSLKNRMIIFGLNGTPTIATVFVGPKVADLFYTQMNFRWAYGAFAIILVGISVPALVLMGVNERKAIRSGELKRATFQGTWMQAIYHYVVELDVVGVLLLTAATILFLLPFSIAKYAPQGWNTGYIIAMIVVGVVFGAFFTAWEKYFAPVQFMPWKYLKEPTILGSACLAAVLFISTFVWNAYFGSYLQVVNRLTITTAGYVLNCYTLTSAIFSPIFGMIISVTGNFKWPAYVGVPVMLLGTALLIPFRQPDTSAGILAMTQIFVGFGAGLFTVCGQLAVMVPVGQQEVAATLAIWHLFGSIGAAVGFAVAGGMWNNMLPKQLYDRLPEGSKGMADKIFGDIRLQMSFADGTPQRAAVVGAYADVMRKMAIVGVCFMPLCLLSIYFWRNVNVKKLEHEKGKQSKGNVW